MIPTSTLIPITGIATTMEALVNLAATCVDLAPAIHHISIQLAPSFRAIIAVNLDISAAVALNHVVVEEAEEVATRTGAIEAEEEVEEVVTKAATIMLIRLVMIMIFRGTSTLAVEVAVVIRGTRGRVRGEMTGTVEVIIRRKDSKMFDLKETKYSLKHRRQWQG